MCMTQPNAGTWEGKKSNSIPRIYRINWDCACICSVCGCANQATNYDFCIAGVLYAIHMNVQIAFLVATNPYDKIHSLWTCASTGNLVIVRWLRACICVAIADHFFFALVSRARSASSNWMEEHLRKRSWNSHKIVKYQSLWFHTYNCYILPDSWRLRRLWANRKHSTAQQPTN